MKRYVVNPKPKQAGVERWTKPFPTIGLVKREMNTAQLPRENSGQGTSDLGADSVPHLNSVSAEVNAPDSQKAPGSFDDLHKSAAPNSSQRSAPQAVDLFREDKTSFVSGTKCSKIMSAESYFSDHSRLAGSDSRNISAQYLPVLEKTPSQAERAPLHELPPFSSGTQENTSMMVVPVWKRALDLALILLTLPFWLVLMVVLAGWLKIVSPGPLFFRQERVGFRGKRFMLLKFRTMKLNVETQSHERYLEQLMQQNTPMTKLDAAGDPRIIPGGRFLRAMGLDELPQILNVLRGEMSLVGPRPSTVAEFNRYQPRHKERVNAAPGLTGYWQVNGKNKTTFAAMIEMDIFYSENLSLWLDLTIIFRTPAAIAAQLFESRVRTRFQPNANKSFSKRYAR